MGHQVEPHTPSMNFLMVIMASGIARGCIHTATVKATELCNMAATLLNHRLTETCSLGLPCTSLILDIHVMMNTNLSNQDIH